MRLKHLLLLTALAFAMPLTIAAENGEDKNLSPVPQYIAMHSAPVINNLPDVQANGQTQSPARAKVSTDTYVIIGGVRYLLKNDGTATVTNILFDSGEGYFDNDYTNIKQVSGTIVIDGEEYDYSFKAQVGDLTVNETVTYNGETYNVTTLSANAFANSNITSITLPASITKIETTNDHSMVMQNNFLEINVENEVHTTWSNKPDCYASYLFLGCEYLKKATINCNVTSLGKFCFAGCYNLESITLPQTLTIIDEGMFAGCHSLKQLDIPQNVNKIDVLSFYLNGIPAGTELVSYETYKKYFPLVLASHNIYEASDFNYNTLLGQYNCYDNYTHTYANTVGNGLESVNLENGTLKEISKMAFYDDHKFNITSLPTTVDQLGEKALAKTLIKSLTVNNSELSGLTTYDISNKIQVPNITNRNGEVVNVLVPAEHTYSIANNTDLFRVAKKHERSVTSGNFGSLCLGYDAVKPTEGIEIYEVVGKKTEDGAVKYITLDVVPAETTVLTAGKPYFFKGTADGTVNFAPIDEFTCVNKGGVIDGAHGVLTAGAVDEGVYMLQGGSLHPADGSSTSAANRVYIDMSSVPEITETRALSAKAMRMNVND